MNPARNPRFPQARDGHPCIRIDLAGCTTKAELLARIAHTLHFPDWFGHNWDALADCLCDLSWLPGTSWHIEFNNVEALNSAEPATFAILLEILAEAASFWLDHDGLLDYGFTPGGPEATPAPAGTQP
ncbi:MAG: barstar family protein [Thauera sp.]|jgi:RNAse (barnase) inhibitor barstar|nr:barstar family protein [Thauera sp.]